MYAFPEDHCPILRAVLQTHSCVIENSLMDKGIESFLLGVARSDLVSLRNHSI
jgi:hypothetical protein